MPFLKKSRRVAAGQSILKDARMRFREAAGTGGAYLVLEVVEASAGNIPVQRMMCGLINYLVPTGKFRCAADTAKFLPNRHLLRVRPGAGSAVVAVELSTMLRNTAANVNTPRHLCR